MKRTLTALLLLAVLGCNRQGALTPSDGGPPVALTAEAPDAGVTLTLAKLDAFLRYERALQAVPGPGVGELRRLTAGLDGGSRALEDAYAALKRRAVRAEELRSAQGLSLKEVQTLEALTADMAMARAGTLSDELGRAVSELEAARDQLPPESRAAVDRSLARLRSEEARVRSLSDLRATWGDAWVDLVLQREQDCSELWSSRSR